MIHRVENGLVHNMDIEPAVLTEAAHYIGEFGQRHGALLRVNEHYHAEKILQNALRHFGYIHVELRAFSGYLGENTDYVLARNSHYSSHFIRPFLCVFRNSMYTFSIKIFYHILCISSIAVEQFEFFCI